MPNEKFIAGFEVPVVLLLTIWVFWDVTLIVKLVPEVSKDCMPS
jgi:hypothetical protein